MANRVQVLNVDGMSCSHCENSVKKSVGELKGVDNVTVNLSTKKVAVEFDSDRVSISDIKDAIEDLGYDVTL